MITRSKLLKALGKSKTNAITANARKRFNPKEIQLRDTYVRHGKVCDVLQWVHAYEKEDIVNMIESIIANPSKWHDLSIYRESLPIIKAMQ